MNDKIKELAEQAAHDVRVQHGNAYWRLQDETSEDVEWQKRFAELIIRECIEACNENNTQVHSHLGISASVKSIRQRFGIKDAPST